MDNASPGCAKASDRFRPLVIVAHKGVYFCEGTFVLPDVAVAFAELSISNESYSDWHFHATS